VKTRTHSTAFDTWGTPEVERVEYDLWELRITARFETQRSPVYVVFKAATAFRVLDEGALLEYWSPATRSAGWVWKVEGGWLGREVEDGVARDVIQGEEYLVCGVDECVSVIATEPPQVYCPDDLHSG
jgi:hypothetical protein